MAYAYISHGDMVKMLDLVHVERDSLIAHCIVLQPQHPLCSRTS
jgi:hypothetical protein